jgi:hypothetical protein
MHIDQRERCIGSKKKICRGQEEKKPPPSHPRVAIGRNPNSSRRRAPSPLPPPPSPLPEGATRRSLVGAGSGEAFVSSRAVELARVSSTRPEPGSSAGKQGGRRSSGRRTAAGISRRRAAGWLCPSLQLCGGVVPRPLRQARRGNEGEVGSRAGVMPLWRRL